MPRNRRERNSRPAMIKGIGHVEFSSTALAGAHDLDAVARHAASSAARPRAERRAVERDRNPALAGVDRLLLQQRGKRRRDERLVLPVDPDVASAAAVVIAVSVIPRPRAATETVRCRTAGSPDRRAVEHEPRDRVGGDRRQQNSVAMMAGGVDRARRSARARGSAHRRGCPGDDRPTSHRSAVPRPPAPPATPLRAA